MRRRTERSCNALDMTSQDESQRHACGQQSLCQVTDLADAPFVTNDLGVHFSLSLACEA